MNNTLLNNKIELHELQVIYNSGENISPEIAKRILLLERIIELQQCDDIDKFVAKLVNPHLENK